MAERCIGTAGGKQLNGGQWFALLSTLATLGETGRDYAHRISQFHPEYNSRETAKQFNDCLKWSKRRDGLETFNPL